MVDALGAVDSPRRVIGWKIGLTSKAMQSALNIDIPDSGVLLDDMDFANGTEIPAGRFIQPRIEAEIAFVMKSHLASPHITRADIVAATDYVVPAIEILDTRIARTDTQTGKSAMSLTQSATTQPMPELFWAQSAIELMLLTCAGFQPLSAATVK